MLRKILICIFIIKIYFLVVQTKLIQAQPEIDSTNHIIHVINQFEDYFVETIEDWDVPGAAVAIIKDNKIVYIRAYGIREVGRHEKVDIHTAFRLASVSKGFASMLTGLLVKDGVLKWDDKVVKYLPNFSLKSLKTTKSLTIRHILSHTSGLPAHTFTNLLEDDIPLPEIYLKLREVSSIAPVGNVYSYQNVLYSLICDIIKSATGKQYETLVRERIFVPLGMYDSSLGKDSFLAFSNHTMPHIRENFDWAATRIKNAYYAVPPSAGVNASILDMARWLRAMMGGEPEIISPEVIKQVTTPAIKTPQEKRKYRWRDRLRNAYYGLGWRIYDYAGSKIIYHGGWVEGYRAEIGFIPDDKIGIAVLMNCESMAANLILPAFFDMYLELTEFELIQSDF